MMHNGAHASQNAGFHEPAPQFGHGALSPLGNIYMSPTSAAIHQKRDNDHPPLEDKQFELKDWLISPKTPKLFEHFSGKPEAYPNWSSRVKDHLMRIEHWLGQIA